jgi:hypothetical protein
VDVVDRLGLNGLRNGHGGFRGYAARTLYTGGEFSANTLVAFISGTVAGIGFLLFLVNLVSTIGLRTLWSLVLPDSKVKPLEASSASG